MSENNFYHLSYRPTLQQAQDIIDGYVQIIWCNQGQLLVDEEGLNKGLEPNYKASALAGFQIVGPAIYLQGPNMWQEETNDKD